MSTIHKICELVFFFSSRRRHTRWNCDWSSDVCSSDLLGRGEQILVLRKGGIREGPAGFQVDHPGFLLFPTLFHQQRESVLPAAQRRFDAIAPHWPGPDRLRLEFGAEVAAWKRIDSLEAAQSLRGQHLWR